MRNSKSLRVLPAAVFVTAASVLSAGTGVAAVQRDSAELTQCGHVDGTIAVTTHDVRCATGRAVAKSYVAGTHHLQGFTCKRHKVNVAAGWNATCTRRQAIIYVTPE